MNMNNLKYNSISLAKVNLSLLKYRKCSDENIVSHSVS